MRRSSPMILALLSLAMLPAALASAVTTVAPSGYAAVEGNGANSFPFNNFEGRYQQAYDASQFGSSPITISEIAFRTDGTAPGASPFPWQNLLSFSIRLSTSENPVGSLSPMFAANIGLDDTEVFSVSNGLYGGSDAAGAGPNAFNVILTLQTPFTYDPTAGDLLMEVLMSSNQKLSPASGVSYLDEVASTTGQFDVGVQRIFDSGGDVNSTEAPNPDEFGSGLVTRFTYEVVPEPGTGLLLVAGLLGLAARRRI